MCKINFAILLSLSTFLVKLYTPKLNGGRVQTAVNTNHIFLQFDLIFTFSLMLDRRREVQYCQSCCQFTKRGLPEHKLPQIICTECHCSEVLVPLLVTSGGQD